MIASSEKISIRDGECIEFLGLNHVQSHSYSVFCQEKLVLPLVHYLLPPQASPWDISQVSIIWPCCGDVTPPRCPGFKGTACSKLLLRACDSFQLGTIIDHTVTYVLGGGGYVNTSFHVSKAKAKDRVMVTACLYIISWECVNVITCVMSPVPQQYDVCSPAPNVLQYPMWVSLCFFNTPVSIFLVAYWHTVTRATSPSPFLSNCYLHAAALRILCMSWILILVQQVPPRCFRIVWICSFSSVS